jgi:hypothetical protein
MQKLKEKSIIEANPLYFHIQVHVYQ